MARFLIFSRLRGSHSRGRSRGSRPVSLDGVHPRIRRHFLHAHVRRYHNLRNLGFDSCTLLPRPSSLVPHFGRRNPTGDHWPQQRATCGREKKVCTRILQRNNIWERCLSNGGKLLQKILWFINDLHGQTHSPAVTDHYFHLKFVFFLRDYEKWGRAEYVQTSQTSWVKIFTVTVDLQSGSI